MWKLRLTDEANDDLAAIAVFIAQSSGNRRTGTRFKNRLKARCKKLARLPQIMGRSRSELAEGLRSVPEGNYLIFIRYIGDTLEIVMFSEGSRDFEALFGSQDEPDAS